MAIQVAKIYKSSMKPYEMKLIAGKEGLDHVISWVHILENVEVRGYVRGGEVVFTTGIVYQNNQWLLEFVKGLCQYHASCLVINIGPYINDIPQEVIDYCNENHLPLFIVPWHIQLVDITQDYCTQILQEKQKESNASSIFEDIIFSSADIKRFQTDLINYGYDMNGNFTILLIDLSSEEDGANIDSLNIIKNNAVMFLNKWNTKHNAFLNNGRLIVVINGTGQERIKEFVHEMSSIFPSQRFSYGIQIGVGKSAESMNGIIDSYLTANQSLTLVKKCKEKSLFYEELGIYKILLDMKHKEILNEIYQNSMGKLEQMDLANGTDYVRLLRNYFAHNCNVQKLADELYVHRNTILYKLKQIQKLSGLDVNKIEDRFQILLALKINTIL